MDKWLHCAGTVLAQVGSPLSHHSLHTELPGVSYLGQLNYLQMAVELVVWLGKENKKMPQSYGYIAEFSSAPLMASHIGIDVKLLTAILAFSHLDNCLPF